MSEQRRTRVSLAKLLKYAIPNNERGRLAMADNILDLMKSLGYRLISPDKLTPIIHATFHSKADGKAATARFPKERDVPPPGAGK